MCLLTSCAQLSGDSESTKKKQQMAGPDHDANQGSPAVTAEHSDVERHIPGVVCQAHPRFAVQTQTGAAWTTERWVTITFWSLVTPDRYPSMGKQFGVKNLQRVIQVCKGRVHLNTFIFIDL